MVVKIADSTVPQTPPLTPRGVFVEGDVGTSRMEGKSTMENQNLKTAAAVQADVSMAKQETFRLKHTYFIFKL